MSERPPAPLYLDRIFALGDQLEDSAGALEFLETYLGMLPGRLARILAGLHARDQETSADAILSLKITSSMAGALGTEACCLELEMLVRDKLFARAISSAGRLTGEVSALCAYAPDLITQARQGFTDVRGMAA